MKIRSRLAALLVALCFALPATAAERIVHIREGAAVDHAAGVYPNLEELRKALEAVPPEIYLDDGTVILLHGNDSSLKDGLPLPAGVDITIRSAGGGSTIYVPVTDEVPAPIAVLGENPLLRLENINFAASSGIYAVEALAVVNTPYTDQYGNFQYATTGVLSVSNSTFAAGGGASTILLGGNMKATFTDSVVHNDGFAGILHAQGHLELNVIFTGKASDRTIWTGDWDLGTTIAGLGNSADVNVSVAANKHFHLQGLVGGNVNSVEKTGAGVWKLDGGYAGALNIRQGTVHFGTDLNYAIYAVDENGDYILDADGNYTVVNLVTWTGGNIHVGKDGVFKPTIDAGNLEDVLNGKSDIWYSPHSRFELGSFTTEIGARLEVGGISTMPQFDLSVTGNTGGYVRTVEVGYSMIATDYVGPLAPSMTIDNKLMKASLKPGDLTQETLSAALGADPDDYNGYLLHIERVNDLSILDGVGSFADVYRKMDLSDVERDMLDDIYNRGGAGQSLGFLQTMGGYQVQNTLLAMRHHQANLLQKINRRVTGYQKEDLLDLSVNGGELCDYSEWNACTDHGEMWAFIDQTWMSQNDVDSLAGYRYQSQTLGLGYDWHTGSWIYGGLLNYATGKMKLRNNYGSYTDIDSLLGAGYVSWAQEGYYLTGVGVAGYGWNDSTSTYALSGVKAVAKTGDYASSVLGLNLEGGYMWETEFLGTPLRVTPYGSLGYSRLHRNAVRESGADFGGVSLNRQFRAADWNVWEIAAGARWAMPLERDGYTLVPSFDVAWTRTLGSLETTGGDAHFVDRDMTGWKIPVMASNRSSLRMSANLDAQVRQNLTVGAGYEFEWRHRYWKHQLSLGMTLGF